jgi:hypothetical protein
LIARQKSVRFLDFPKGNNHYFRLAATDFAVAKSAGDQ